MPEGRKVALIVTSHDRLGDTGDKTGYWLQELAVAYYSFLDSGFEVLLASPLGGAAPVDPRSVDKAQAAPPDAPEHRWLGDAEANERVSATIPTSDLDAAELAAAYLVGGRGAMWDMPKDQALGRLLRDLLDGGKIVGSICHGAAAFVGAVTSGGEPLVRGRELTCYSDDEERAAGVETVVPFLLESELRTLGADVLVGERGTDFTIEDGLLVSGQNPASSASTAKAVVAALSGSGKG